MGSSKSQPLSTLQRYVRFARFLEALSRRIDPDDAKGLAPLAEDEVAQVVKTISQELLFYDEDSREFLDRLRLPVAETEKMLRSFLDKIEADRSLLRPSSPNVNNVIATMVHIQRCGVDEQTSQRLVEFLVSIRRFDEALEIADRLAPCVSAGT